MTYIIKWRKYKTYLFSIREHNFNFLKEIIQLKLPCQGCSRWHPLCMEEWWESHSIYNTYGPFYLTHLCQRCQEQFGHPSHCQAQSTCLQSAPHDQLVSTSFQLLLPNTRIQNTSEMWLQFYLGDDRVRITQFVEHCHNCCVIIFCQVD